MSHGTSALKDAKNISSSLSRAQSQLEATLSQAESATAALHDDGSTIKEILNEHAYELKGGLAQTKNKLKTLNYVELWEKYSIYGSLGFFCMTVLYIVLKRTRVVVYAAVWILSLFGTQSPVGSSVVIPPPENPAPVVTPDPLSVVQRRYDNPLLDQSLANFDYLEEL